MLTRLGGHELALNPDLIERAEPTPDTVITMVDGHKIVVSESISEVVTRIRTWRASVAALAWTLARAGGDDGDVETFTELATQDLSGRPAEGSVSARVLRLPRREG